MLGEIGVGLLGRSLLTEGLETTEKGVLTANSSLNVVGVTLNGPASTSIVEVELVEFRRDEGLTFFNVGSNGEISDGILGGSSEGNRSNVEVQNGVGVRNIDEVVSNTFLVRRADFILGEFGGNLRSTQDVVNVELEASGSIGPVTEGDESEEDSDTRVRE